MQTIKIGSRQCLIDLAMQHAGSAEAAFDMMVQYNIPITADLNPATELPAPAAKNEAIKTLYKTEMVMPASITISELMRQEGIGYWIIENDFVVS